MPSWLFAAATAAAPTGEPGVCAGVGSGGGAITVTAVAVIGEVIPLRERGRYQGALGAVDELVRTADLLAAPIAKALLGKGLLPDDHLLTTGGIGLLGTAEQERRVPHRHFLGDAHQGRGGTDHHFLRPTDQRTLHLIIRAQTGGAEGAHLELAVGGLGDLLGEQLGRAALIAVLVETVTEADHARTHLIGMGSEAGERAAQHGSGEDGEQWTFHRVYLLLL